MICLYFSLNEIFNYFSCIISNGKFFLGHHISSNWIVLHGCGWHKWPNYDLDAYFNSFFSGSVTACDPHKIYYTDGVFDSAYVLIDVDSGIDAACEDSCVYTK